MSMLLVCLYVGAVLVPVSSSADLIDVRVRVIGGDKPNTGRVEIHGPGGWGTICSDDRKWNLLSAGVVCRQLGYTDVVLAQQDHMGLYGHSMGTPYVTNVECDGDEEDLFDCNYDIYTGRECSSVAAVFCKIPGYVGCYDEDRLLSNENTDNELMTIDFCIGHCYSKNYQYAALHHRYCHCSNSGGGISEAMSTSCNFPCPGNMHDICGGLQFYSVYDTRTGYCDDPGTPRNGLRDANTYRADDTYHFGAYVSYSCRDNLWLIGPEVIQCTIGDLPDYVTWSDVLPQCSDVPPPTTTEMPWSTPDTELLTISTEEYSSIPNNTSDNQNESLLGLIALLLLPIVVLLVVIIVVMFKRRNRLHQDVNGNSRSTGNQDATEMKPIAKVSPTSKVSTLSYAEIEDMPKAPAAISKNGISQHESTYNANEVVKSSQGPSGVVKHGLTQHELTYNNDQVIPSSSMDKGGSSTSYAEIDESQMLSAVDKGRSNISHKEPTPSNMVSSLSYAEIGDSQMPPSGGSNTSHKKPTSSSSYAEIGDSQIPPSVNKGRYNLVLPNPSNHDQGTASNMISSGSYAEIEDSKNTNILSSASYAEIQDPHTTNPPKDSVASYMSFEAESRTTNPQKDSVASYITFQVEPQTSPKSDTSGEGDVFYEEFNRNQKRPVSEQCSIKRPTSELPTIREFEETAADSRRTSLVGTVENTIYESADS
ncbi:uncharacterized protein [Amphiura filiformis]|uniref:uncharacterized protein n=1 Tax=Amphiura filiformis TaxID=82378 RepID=UPI003B22364B